jgi:hypothetical protein
MPAFLMPWYIFIAALRQQGRIIAYLPQHTVH